MTIIRWMRRTTTGRCRIWVKNGPDALETGCLFYPQKQTSLATLPTSISSPGVRPALNAIVIMTERHVVDQHERELHM
jgi:hypothetical protein